MWRSLSNIFSQLPPGVKTVTIKGKTLRVVGPPGSLAAIKKNRALLQAIPSCRCPNCGLIDWWLSIYGQVTCGICHPPADPSLVASRVTAIPTRYCWRCVYYHPSSTKEGLGWCEKQRAFKAPEALACQHFQASERRVA